MKQKQPPRARLVRRFTPPEDTEIEARRIAGTSLGKIAKQVGRQKSSVQMRLQWLAERDERAEVVGA